MIEISISLPTGTMHRRRNGLLELIIDERESRTDLWLSQLNLWLARDGETTDTALLQINKDEEFEIHIDSQNEHFSEGEEFYCGNYPVFEYAQLILFPESNDMPPMFTLAGEDIDIKEIGGDLISILNKLGQDRWELACREDEITYLLKREKRES